MPISLQVQIIRHAISPLLAINIFLNLRGLDDMTHLFVKANVQQLKSNKRYLSNNRCWTERLLTLDSKKWLTVLDGLAVLNVNLDDFASKLRLDLIHQLHRLDNADDTFRFNPASNFYKGVSSWRRRTIKGSHYG